MGAPPTILLLEEKPMMFYVCNMCKERTRKNKFSWKSWFTNDEIVICRECAYKESYGTKNMKKAKSNRILEKKEINK
jgi:superfamily II helicase|tara:strand:- start:168 stop:398 length:231 start_codon:yes stop_codon:yes gene_type:complete